MSDTTKVKNWSFPFKPKAGKLDPIQHLTAMAQASGGYYPVGANGQWHGGVHFDGETEAVFDQSQVCCIADGEVIAYRIDTRHPESKYFTPAGASFNAVFSRSFVLVKHHLEAPAKPTAAGTAPEPPPSLTFFSLYMHLLNWEGYTGTNAPNPPAFMGETLYKVKADKATDPVKGLRIRAEPRTGRVVALLPKGSKVRVGDAHPIHSGWYRLLAVVEGRTLPAVAITENMWVFPGEMEQTAEAGIFLVGERANDLEPTLAPEKGLNVRKNGNGRRDDPIVGVLPLGATFRLESSTGTYCKLKEIVEGKDIAPLSPDSAGNLQGFVHLGSLESTRSAPEPNKVYVLPTPHPIKAGELIGHLGHYQNENDRSPQRLLHLEVFSCEDVPAFIAKSQAWAAGLPDEQKTLLKVHKNASKLIPHRDDINASNPPKISDAGTTIGVDLIIPQSLLDGLPADSKLQENTTLPGSATPTTTRWWRLDNLLADNDGNPISGWLAEQDLITTRHSPWEWEGYDFIQETGSPVGKATYFYEAWRRLTNEESANYRALVSQEDQGPIKARLYDIIRPGGAKGLLTAQEISPALAKPWHAQSIAQLVTHYESEWYWKPDKWDELDPLMGHLPGIDPNLNWASEKERIKELCWWAEMADKHGISADGKAWHFQPALFLSNHSRPNKVICSRCRKDISITYEFLRKISYESAPEERIKEISDELNIHINKYEANSCSQLKHFLAQAKHETKGFTAFRESLNYVSYTGATLYAMAPTAIDKGFERKGMTFSSREEKIQWIQDNLIRNDAAYGEHAFGSNEQPGKDYRGRGLLHLTHYDTYKRCGVAIGLDIHKLPELVEGNSRAIVETGLWFWKDNRLKSIAEDRSISTQTAVTRITRIINGGLKGIEERNQFMNEISITFSELYGATCE
ncbi:glycoside hydrolase family 19 protein [Metapseudomonas otitidis]|uniref:glycoside hydrolase family 19 protein n=1 Tax=Metapseudomonas otitidis TaxID=319939 RepID=UPI00244AF018|nr:glycoside hydrolase family 19 protein [Pseudomonas otitidis]MDH0338559.1 hypothetical protein [Pseudomonas otitidis]